MQEISLLTKEDVRNEIRQAIQELILENQLPKSDPSSPEEYLHGLQSLANFIGTGLTTAWRLVKEGKIPKYQTGKKLFFKKSEVLKALSKHR